MFHARGKLDPADRIAQVDSVSASPEKVAGAPPHISPDGDGLAKVIDLAGEKCWRTQPNRHSDSRYLYFDADYTFLEDGLEPVRVTVEYLDAGPDRFALEYDSPPTRRPKASPSGSAMRGKNQRQEQLAEGNLRPALRPCRPRQGRAISGSVQRRS